MDFQRMLGNRYSIKVSEVIKTNGVKLKGLIIKAIDQNISPTIYLEPFYQMYCDNLEDDDTLKDIEMEIYNVYIRSNNNG